MLDQKTHGTYLFPSVCGQHGHFVKKISLSDLTFRGSSEHYKEQDLLLVCFLCTIKTRGVALEPENQG